MSLPGVSPAADRLAERLVQYRRSLAALCLLTTLLLSIGITRTDFDSSLGVLLPDSDPLLSEREQFQEHFPPGRSISVLVLPDNDELFSPPALYALADLQRNFRQIPGARSIDSILNYQSPTGEVSLVPWPWQDFERFSEEQLQDMREAALEDPLARNTLLSRDADLALVSIELDPRPLDRAASRELAASIERLQDELQERHPEVMIRASAEVLFEQSTRAAMISDLSRLLPALLLLCMLFICYCFRSWTAGILVLLLALLTVLMTLGVRGWLQLPFNTISVMAPLVVVIIAVADAVHILSIHRQALVAGHSAKAAMQYSLAFNLRPVSLATVTTAIGFLSLNLVSAPALSEFGSVVALGVGFAWLLSLCLLPAMALATVGHSNLHRPTALIATRITKPPLQLASRLFREHPRSIFRICSALGLIAIILLPLNRIDFDRMDFISRDSPLHGYYEIINERMDRGPMLSYAIRGPVTDPQFLRQVDAFAGHLREKEDIGNVAGLVELVKAVNQALADSELREQAFRIPDDAGTVAQHLSDYQQLQSRSFPLRDFVNADQDLQRLFVTTHSLSNSELVELDQQIREAFQARLPQADLLQGSGTLLFARMDQTVTVELLRGYALSLIMITLTLVIGLRSLRFGLLSLVPNMMPALLVFGFWGLINGQLDPFVLMLFSISIGLVVDDTVHILSTYLRRRKEGGNTLDACEAAVFRAGPALLITTLVLALGATVLLAASTLYFQQAAQLLVPIVVVALVLDLTFLPVLLRKIDRDPPGSGLGGVGRL